MSAIIDDPPCKASRAMNGDSANKFISALVKSLQTLCHGYVEFNDGIEIIGHLYLNIDSGSSFDYVVKEKVCKNAENSTVFVSKSFQAQAPAEESITRKDKDDEAVPVFEDTSDMSPTTGTSRLQSAINSINNVLSGSQQDVQKGRLLDHAAHHSPVRNTSKRKREHNGSYTSLDPPYKYTTLQATSSYFSGPPSSKQAVDRNHSEHFNNSSHAEFFGGDSNQSSGMGQEEDDDLDLDVTFVKEEYESQRNSGQRGISAGGASRLSQDPTSSQSNLLHDGGTIGYTSTTTHHQAPQQFASGTAVELGNQSQNFQDPSTLEISQHSQGSQNQRSDVSLSSRPLDCTLSGMALDLTCSTLTSTNLSSMSDTLQLGIKLFGPTFVADVAAGDLSLPLTISTDDTRAISDPPNASVFPEMFDVTTVSSNTSLKPNQKVLWHDRKDKLRRSILMRKANSTKIRNRSGTKKNICNENVSSPLSPADSTNTFGESNTLIDPYGGLYKRKRGRPPKILKMISRSEFLLQSTTGDPEFSIQGSSRLSENYESEKNCTENNVVPSRCISLTEGSSKRIRGSYRQYTPADKLKIVDFGIKYGSTAASRKYSIPESTVRSWTKKMDIFLMQMKNEEKCETNLSDSVNTKSPSTLIETLEAGMKDVDAVVDESDNKRSDSVCASHSPVLLNDKNIKEEN